MDPINQAFLAILTALPNIAMCALGGLACGLLAYGIVGSVLGYNLSRTFDDLPRGEAVKGAWADLKFEVAREFRLTKESIVGKAYAAARLVKLLGALTLYYSLGAMGVVAALVGFVTGPVGVFLDFLKQCFVGGYEASFEASSDVLENSLEPALLALR